MDAELRIKKLDEIRSKEPYSKMEVLYKNQRTLMDVHQIDLNYLVYNKHNGRIASRVKSWERQHRELNLNKPEDKKLVEAFLWDSHQSRNKTTLEDLKRNGQMKYGIVTRDGIIIDGNRRALLLGRLDRGVEYFKAVILNERLAESPTEIMKLETKYQMGEDEKLGYNAIEKYLKCKDLKDNGFDQKAIGEMMSEEPERITEWLEVMDLMDEYLDNLDYTGIYTRLDDTEGIFVDLQHYLKKYKNDTKLATWDYQDMDVSDLKAVFFHHIRARFSGEGKLYRFIGRPSKKESFFCNEPIWRKFSERHFAAVDAVKEKSVDEIRKQSPDADLDKLLKSRDEEWAQKVEAALKANLGQTKRNLDDVNDQNAPLELLRRAKQTLEAIDPNVEAFSGEAVEAVLKEINTLTWDFKKALERKMRKK